MCINEKVDIYQCLIYILNIYYENVGPFDGV